MKAAGYEVDGFRKRCEFFSKRILIFISSGKVYGRNDESAYANGGKPLQPKELKDTGLPCANHTKPIEAPRRAKGVLIKLSHGEILDFLLCALDGWWDQLSTSPHYIKTQQLILCVEENKKSRRG